MERCPPLSGRRLIFSACGNLYRKNNALFACESSSKESGILSIRAYSHRDTELDYESDSHDSGVARGQRGQAPSGAKVGAGRQNE